MQYVAGSTRQHAAVLQECKGYALPVLNSVVMASFPPQPSSVLQVAGFCSMLPWGCLMSMFGGFM